MKSIANRLFTFTAATLFLGTVAYGQTSLRATVPFGFQIPGGAAAAGNYDIQLNTSGSGKIVELRNVETRRAMLAVASSAGRNPNSPSAARLVFRCNAAGCALSELWTGDAGYTVPVSHPKKGEYLASIPLRVSHGD